MKNVTKLLCLLLVCVMLLPMGTFAKSNQCSEFTHPVDISYMCYGSPVIDGELGDGEGWSNVVSIGKENLVPMSANFSTYIPTGEYSFAWDDDNMYFYAEVFDDEFHYSDGVNEDVIFEEAKGINDIPDNNPGWNGDVVALELNPLYLLVNEAGLTRQDMSAWLCFGLFEDGHVGAYISNRIGEDVTAEITAAGTVTDTGWRFEAALPWDLVAKHLDRSSYARSVFNKDDFTAHLAESGGCIYLCDRVYDEELETLAWNNLFATASVFTLDGLLVDDQSYPVVGAGGLRIVAVGEGKDSSEYQEKTEPTSIKWVNNFSDVKEESWYYEAVADTCDKEWFSGTGETTFSPSSTLTRAMLVTTLARVARADADVATGEMFNDVPAQKWYAGPVEWACGVGITSGTGEGYFSPGTPVTRQEIAMFLYKLAIHKGYRVDDVDASATDAFSDKDTVSSWAENAVNWAVTKGLISGIKSGDTTILSPKSGATRSQCAQILWAFDNAEFSHLAKEGEYANVTICGNELSLYTVIYGDGEHDKRAAEELAKYLNLTANTDLEVYGHNEKEASKYEILVGETNREPDWCEVDRSEMSIEGYVVVTHDDKLLISGGEKNGALYGVYGFLKDYVGWIFASSASEGRIYRTDIAIEDGISDVENSIIEYMVLFGFDWVAENKNDRKFKIRAAGERAPGDDGYQCSIPYLLNGRDWSTHLESNPCYSDPEMIDRIIDLMLEWVDRYPDKVAHSFGLNDSAYYCMCENCIKIYREEKSRSGTYVRMANRVMEEIEKKHPGDYIILTCYNFTNDTTVTKLHEKIVVRYNTIAGCNNHAIGDPNCNVNKYHYNNLHAWREVCQTLWTADDRGYKALFDLDALYDDIKLYNSLDSKGYATWGQEGEIDIDYLRQYLFVNHFWDRDITRDDYHTLKDEFLEVYVGDGWKDIVDFIDIMAELQSFRHIGWNGALEDTIPEALYLENKDYIDSLYDSALEKAETDTQRENIAKCFNQYVLLEGAY